MPEHNVEQAADDWARRFLQAWRAAWQRATPAVRAYVSTFFLTLESPVQVRVLVCTEDDAPVVAFALVVRQDRDVAERISVEAAKLVNQSDGFIGSIARSLLQQWSTMRGNWLPERGPEPPLRPWQLRMGNAMDGSSCHLSVPGPPGDLDIEDFLDHWFKLPTPPLPDLEVRRAPPVHLYDREQEREGLLFERWLYLESAQFLQALGLPGRWWCGLFLDRADVFGTADSGDIDFIAGPLEFDLTPEAWVPYVKHEAAKCLLATQPSWYVAAAAQRAVDEGHVVWPPRVDFLVSGEVKASWFDGEWHQTHKRAKRRLAGQLRYSLDRGVDHVAFLHLGVTKPKSHSWLDAGGQLDQAMSGFPEVVGPDGLRSCAQFRAAIGALLQDEEHHEAAMSPFVTIAPVVENPARLTADRAWRMGLQERLGRLPPPRHFRTFIRGCSSCKEWRHTGAISSEHQCRCGGRRRRE